MNVQIAHFYKYPSVGNELCAHTQCTHFLGRPDDFRMWAHAFCAYGHCSILEGCTAELPGALIQYPSTQQAHKIKA